MQRLRRHLDRLKGFLLGIPRAALAALAAAALVLVAVGGVFMYRTYTFVQHDNDFCLSCHLMQEPFELFAQSEHRGLPCKACHQPTMMVRTQMALTQLLENPDSIAVHAEVPNRACAACHIDGDPEKWRQIRSSVGHRVHLESKDPSLQGLMCVECHSASIHKFTAVSRTCAQSGCHEDTQIRLGRMGGMTIHCVGCHDFSRPASDTVIAGPAVKPLQPRREECMSCHSMRTLLADFPEDEPHEAACGACHNPHDQHTPRQAQRTCAASGCHAQPDTLTPMHRGLAVGVLQDCLACHGAHEFRARGDDCVGCHQDVFERGAAPLQARRTPAATRAVNLLPERWRPTFMSPTPRRELAFEFSHVRHRQVDCVQCHSSDREHGAVMVTGVRECRECHHTGQVARECAACHTSAELRASAQRVRQEFRLSVGRAQTRELEFSHRRHEGVTCASCHGESLTRTVTATCESCHADHHRPASTCISCHAPPPPDAHDRNAHLTCAGSGCHAPVPFAEVPRTRNTCLACHQDLVRHEPGKECVQCHVLPRPRGGRVGAGGGAGLQPVANAEVRP